MAQPTLKKVHLALSLGTMGQFLKHYTVVVGKKAWNHKIMTAFLLLGLYATHKTYGFYRYL